MHPDICWAVYLENVSAPTHSMDDEYPDGMLEQFGGWFACALMLWRE